MAMEVIMILKIIMILRGHDDHIYLYIHFINIILVWYYLVGLCVEGVCIVGWFCGVVWARRPGYAYEHDPAS